MQNHQFDIRLPTLAKAVVFGVLLLGLAVPAQAQRVPGALGIGAQLGDPSGVTLKFFHPESVSYDFLAAWDLDDFFFINGHGLYERHLGDSEQAHYFFGPGAFVGFEDRPNDEDDDTVIGISATFGLNFIFGENLELFGQVTPRLALTPATDGNVGGGAGLRFYF